MKLITKTIGLVATMFFLPALMTMQGSISFAQHKAGKKAQTTVKVLPAPTLDKDIVKALGFSGETYKKQGTAKWKLSNGTTIYSTYPYGKAIKGFAGPTPLFIAVSKQGKIASIAPAANNETPQFWEKVVNGGLLKAWNGKTMTQAKTYTPDAVTGATFSSKGVINTVHAAAKKLAR